MRLVSLVGVLVFFLLVMALPVLGLSFDAGPFVAPPSNISTGTSMACNFTPQGVGSLAANITWFRDGSNYAGANQNNAALTAGVPFLSSSVPTAATSKGQSWLCQVTLFNGSLTNASNSSAVVVLNTLPTLTSPTGVVTVYENTPYLATATAFDADGDSITNWLSVDLNASYYGSSLFTIDGLTGVISFTPADESVEGNHTMSILARDGTDWGGADVIYQVIGVNDSPVFTGASLQQTCIEGTLCEFSVDATDEESDPLTFTANESYLNMDSSGFVSFTPSFAQVGTNVIVVNVSDSLSTTTDFLYVNVTSVNHVPLFTYNSSATSSGSQNNASFTFVVNATDTDPLDAIIFSIQSYCPYPNPWNITVIDNGTGSVNASAQITRALNVTDNNSFVACRNVTITAQDYYNGTFKDTASFNTTFAITNVNDPPIIYEYSNYLANNGQTNMSAVLSANGLVFSFLVNATDPDNFTYEGESWNFSLSGHNPSLFQIDDRTGQVTSTMLMNSSYIGNHSFFVVITDDEGLMFNRSMNITVENNSAPVFQALDNSSCSQGVACLKDIVADDAESNLVNYSNFVVQYTPPGLVGSSIVYNDSDMVVYNDTLARALFIEYASFNSSTIAYRFSLTANDSSIGRYRVNATVRDFYGLDVTRSLFFNITNVNDAPQLDDDSDQSVANPIDFGNLVEGVLFNKTIYAIDTDLFYGLDNLTFSYSLQSDNISSMTFVKTGERSATFYFTPNSSHIGNHTINITVTDNASASDLFTLNFSVYPPSNPPIITLIRPYASGGVTYDNGFTSTLGVNNISYVVSSENDSLLFDVTATDPDGDPMTAFWYKDDSLVASPSYSGPGASFYQPTFGFFAAGTVNVTLVLQDEFFSATRYTWLVNVSNTNRPPVKDEDLVPLTVANERSISGRQTFVDFFRLFTSNFTVFVDPDDDLNGNGYLNAGETNGLSFSVNTSGSCDELATITFSGLNMIFAPTAVGTCYTNFIATDGEYNVSSNTIQVDILEVQEQNDNTNSNTNTEIEYQDVTVPIQQDNDVPEELQILFPGIVSIYDNGTVKIPVTIRNTWTDIISRISLSANASIEGLEISFSEDVYPVLAKGEEDNFTITLTNYKLDAPFEVNVSAYIDSLEHTSSVTLYVNALERGQEDLGAMQSRIGFARDLLSDNPECQELNEILDDAQFIAMSNERSAIELINSVINGCKYLIDTTKESQPENPQGTFLGKLAVYTGGRVNFTVLLVVLGILFFGALIVGIVANFSMKKI